MAHLAVQGGTPVMDKYPEKMFHWPIVTDEMRKAMLDVLEDGNMSGLNITKQFETEFAAWQQRKYALAHNTGTNALNAAMFAVGLGPGDEMICTSVTYWASCTGALTLGATVVFCDIDPKTLQMDPDSVEAHITPRTKAIMVDLTDDLISVDQGSRSENRVVLLVGFHVVRVCGYPPAALTFVRLQAVTNP